ncbi:MAG: hypothetical protein V4805_08890 [Pseudomonadota bacterium]
MAVAAEPGLPRMPIERVITLAKDYVRSKQVDVSHHYLGAVEHMHPYAGANQQFWRVEWRPVTAMKGGQIIVIVLPDGGMSIGYGE